MFLSRPIYHVLSIVTFLSISLRLTESSKNDGIIRIPMVRMKSGLEQLLEKGASLELIEGLYNMSLKASKNFEVLDENGKPKPIHDNTTLPLYKYFDTQYYGLVNIGKPGKPFKMLMDTSWGYSWVISKDCPLTRLQCANHERYDHSQSSMYVKGNGTFNISGQYLGYFSRDRFLVGQLSVNQTFAEITDLPFMYALYHTDGTIGLAMRDLATVTPFFYSMFDQSKLKEPIFSFYINRDPTTPRGGSILFGGIDTKHNKSEFTEVDVNSTSYWQFKMDKVTLVKSKKESVDYCTNGCTATADTSSNAIVGPAAEINEINRIIGADRIFFGDRYLIPCANEFKAPKINFIIKNQVFQILGRDYIQKLSYSGLTICLSAFQPAPADHLSDNWVLGGAFLYQFYTAYDIANHKIKIAVAA